MFSIVSYDWELRLFIITLLKINKVSTINKLYICIVIISAY